MGCGGSKLDDLQAVALCRERSHHLEAAIRHRYSLAHAHLSYIHSLKSLASSLQRFFDDLDRLPSPPSPFLPLPTHKKGDPDTLPLPTHKKGDPDTLPLPINPPSSSIPPFHHSHSSSESHLHFHSDSDEDHHYSDGSTSDHETPLPQETTYYMNYARSGGPAASLAFEQRPPQAPEASQFVDSSHFGSYPNYPTYPSSYSNYGGLNTFFGSPPPHSSSYPPPQHDTAPSSSSSRPPPPPPSPPRASTWDFLNPFEAQAQYYPSYPPSRDSKEVRDEEGIPDLEDEEHQHEVIVKEVAVDGGSGGNGGYLKAVVGDDDGRIGGDAIYGMRSHTVGESSGVEYDVHLVDKKVVADEEPVEGRGNVATVNARRPRDVSEAVSEIKVQFDRASDSGSEVAKILEVGKLPYSGKKAVYRVSSKMLDVIAPLPLLSSHSSAYKGTIALPSAEKVDPLPVDFGEDMWIRSKSLSATLQKLYIWEKKLYDEVKAEEKMRLIHERKSRRLKHMDERGAEAHKIESTRTLVRELSTKIRIALQFVDSISNKINKLRDEELWPQIDELIQGLMKMWKVTLECHRSQCQIITEAKNLDAVASGRKHSETHLEATVQLEMELLNWILSFYAWISSQKSYVKALNGWLLMCLHYEPEETPDGIAPFSPGRIGAPPVFVICNHWSQVMDRISESEVFEAMQAFSVTVLQLCDQYTLEQRQRMMANKDMDRRLKVLEREEQKMQKALDIINKKLVLISEQNGLPLPGQLVHHSHSASSGSLQLCLKQIFESMEKFSDDSLKAYEELHLRSEEERLAGENAKVP